MKIWHGDSYREKGIRQLTEYMESRSADRGFLLSFSFATKKNYKAEWIATGEEHNQIFEVIV